MHVLFVPPNEWITRGEAAKLLGLSVSTIRRMQQRGEIRTGVNGTRTINRVSRADVLGYIKEINTPTK